jgi:5-methylcytosine-specific restriction enzyme subunit McrC
MCNTRGVSVSKFLWEELVDNSEVTAGTQLAKQSQGGHVVLDKGGMGNCPNRATIFVRHVEERIIQALKNPEFVMPQFGDEFEFSSSQTFLNVTGVGFDQPPGGLCLTTGNIVGTVRGKVDGYPFTLRISSRFGDIFLRHMIALSEGFFEMPSMAAPPEDDRIDWLLWYLWKCRLKAAHAAGVPKTYVTRTERLPLIRGSLDINTWLRMPIDTGRYTCRFREHSHDNTVTRLINATFRYLARRPDRTDDLLADMQSIRSDFRAACEDQPPRLDRPGADKARNPYFAAYDEVAKLSRLILADGGCAIGTEDEEFSALLFDISLLFEHYIRRLLRNAGMTLEPKGPSSSSINYPFNGKDKMKMLPDIVIRGETKTLILDVKYKRWSSWLNRDNGRARADLFQLMSYAAAHRGRKEYNGSQFGYGFIFPTNSEDQPTVTDYFAELKMHYYVFFLYIPDKEIANSGDSIRRREIKFREDIGLSETCLINKICDACGVHPQKALHATLAGNSG